jgi:DNA-binding protein HU-beta
MNRTELVAALAQRAGVTKTQADAVLSAFAEVAEDVVGKGEEELTILGFLSMKRVTRAERKARNPRTGELIEIPSGYAVKVTAGSRLKAAAVEK